MNRRLWTLWFALGGCGQEHVLLGALADAGLDAQADAALIDATPPAQDAADTSPVDASASDAAARPEGLLSAHFRANGLEGVVAATGCPGACLELEAVITGGAPPYDVLWEDGSSRPKRTLCVSGSSGHLLQVGDRELPLDAMLYVGAQTFTLNEHACDDPAVPQFRFLYQLPAASPGCSDTAPPLSATYVLPTGLTPGPYMFSLNASGSLLGNTISISYSVDGCFQNATVVTNLGLGILTGGGTTCQAVGAHWRYIHLTTARPEAVFRTSIFIDGTDSNCTAPP